MSNFYFLDRWPNLKKLGMQAENYITTDSNASMLKTRILGEQLIDLVLIRLHRLQCLKVILNMLHPYSLV